MIRRNYYITEQQDKKLKEAHEKTGIKPAETVRRALDEYFKKDKK